MRKRAKYSIYDDRGHLHVDCAECERGGNGSDKDKCSCGWTVTVGGQGGCFIGDMLKDMTMEDGDVQD